MTCRIGLVAGALAGAACGRLGFEAQLVGDAPDAVIVDAPAACIEVGNDEDDDGIDDACDRCPHLLGDNADADADGVGDACDPSPESAQRIARFDTFDALPADWTRTGNPAIENGQLVLPATAGGASISRPWIAGRSTFATKFEVDTAVSSEALVALILGDVPNNSLHYCELYGTGPTVFQLTHQLDGGEYLHDDAVTLPVVLENAQGLMAYRITPELRTCVGGLRGDVERTLAAPPPAGIEPTLMNVYALDIPVRFDWLIEIRDVE